MTSTKMFRKDNSNIQSDPPLEQLTARWKEESHGHVIEIEDENPDEISSKSNKRVFYIREIQNLKRGLTTKVKQYTISIESIKRAIEEQSKEDTKAIDKYLNIFLRNLFGECRNNDLSYYDRQVNRAMKLWKYWYESDSHLRSTPLLYKCYECHEGWWRLHLFKEHLKKHDNPYVKLRTEPKNDELCIIACASYPVIKKTITVDSLCWKCGKGLQHHRIADEYIDYQCDGCKLQVSTCTRLKEHQNLCWSYLELESKKYNVDSKERTQCTLCGTFYLKYEQFFEHMLDYHSVRSDEPISMDSNICKLCGGRYITWKYHDCPDRPKSLKCRSCSRKFTSAALKNVHTHFSKYKTPCNVCGKNLAACYVPEHYLTHTKNYAAVRVCLGCDNTVLFTHAKYFKAHMNHHVSYISKRRSNSVMLLPRKCLKGEVVESETLLTIKNEELDVFMKGLENFKKIKATKNVVEDAQSSINPENMIDHDPEIRAMQEQLDAEIKRDMEMEAAISEVFKTSKCYRKLIEKEQMEKQMTSEDSIESDSVKNETTEIIEDEDMSENDLEIVERKDEHFTFTESESETYQGNSSIQYTCKQEDLKSDDNDNNDDLMSDDKPEAKKSEIEIIEEVLSSEILKASKYYPKFIEKEKIENLIVRKSSETDFIKKESAEIDEDEDLSENNLGIIKRKEEYVSLTDSESEAYEINFQSTCKQEDLKSDDNINEEYSISDVKKEVQAFEDEAIDKGASDSEDELERIASSVFNEWDKQINTVRTVSSFSQKIGEADATNEISKQDCNKLFEVIPSTKREIRLNADNTNQANKSVEETNNLYKCNKCDFKGDLNLYVVHSISRCCAVVFKCNICNVDSTTLSYYLDHLVVVHGQEKLACPMCKKRFSLFFTLHIHMTSHIRKTYSTDYVEKVSDRSQSLLIFSCLKCGDNVELHRFFEHWQVHFNNEHANVTSQGDMEIDTDNDIIDITETEPGISQREENAKISQREEDTKISQREENINKSKGITKKKHITKNLVQLETEINKNEESNKQTNDQYECKTCHTKGDWNQYVVHSISRCSAVVVKCYTCNVHFTTLSDYLNHLVFMHGHEKLTCPICKQCFRLLLTLRIHMTSHIRKTFSTDYVEKVSDRSQGRFIFSCLKCGDNVELNGFFKHWQNHFNNEYANVANQRSMKIETDIDIIDIIKTEPGISQREEDTNKSIEITKKKHITENLVKLEPELNRNEESEDQTNDLYECKTCYIEVNWNEYVFHSIARCSEVVFKCNLCNVVFTILSHYLDHLVVHGYEKLACLMCKQRFQLTVMFHKHMTSHIRNIFSKNYVEKNSDRSQGRFIFSCLKCGDNVELHRFFEHWQDHFNNKHANICKEDMEIDTDDIIDITKTEPGISQREEDTNKSNEITKEEHIAENLVQLETEMNRNNESKKRTNDMYECKTCYIEVNWNEYVFHCFAWCSKAVFKCNLCNNDFTTFSHYLEHLDVHGYEKQACFMCKYHFRKIFTFHKHMITHIRKTFSMQYVEKVSNRSQGHFIFSCLKCGNYVELHRFFEHWQDHFINEHANVASQEGMKIDTDNDIIDLTETEPGISQREENTNISKEIMKKKYITENLVELETEINRNEESKHQTNDLYKCKTCYIEVDWNEYVYHVIAWCSEAVFKCNICNDNFTTLSHYLEHLDVHGYEKLVCFMCKKRFIKTYKVHKHMISHIRNIFSKNYLEKISDRSQGRFIFRCIECGDDVELQRFFTHWQDHFYNEHANVANKEDMEIDTDNDIIDITNVEPGISQREENTNKTKEITKEEHIAKNLVQLEREMYRNEESKNQTNDQIKCKTCHTKVDWNQYVVHGFAKCSAVVFKCYICNVDFSTLSHYLEHLDVHGYEKLACLMCKQRFRKNFTFHKHMISHIRKVFSTNYVEKLSNRSQGRFIFSCLKCGNNVKLHRFFEHWQEHFYNEHANVASRGHMEIDTDNDIIDTTETEPGVSQREKNTNKSKGITKEKHISENLVQLVTEMNRNEESKKQTNDLYECKTCNTKGDWNQFVVHGFTRCFAVVFKCDICNINFITLPNYLDHLVVHGYEKLSCLMCKQRFRLTVMFHKHMTSHIRNIFSKNYIEKISDRSQGRFIFRCFKCGDDVELHRFFEHWQEHFYNEHASVAGKEDMEIDTDDIIDITKTEPGISQREEDTNKSNEITKEEHIAENLVQLETEMNRNNESKKRTNDMYECKTCKTKGDWNQYVLHCIVCCATVEYICNKCDRQFSELQHYVDHLVDHGHKIKTCPICGQYFQYPSSLYRHVIFHIRSIFSIHHVKKYTDSLQDSFLFTCLRCGLYVQLEQFFRHWQTHFHDELTNAPIVSEKSYEITKNKRNEVSQIISSSPEMGAGINKTTESKKPTTYLSKCQNCNFEGYWLDYLAHVIVRCASTDFVCNKCDGHYREMQHYVDHLEDHGYEKLTCPICSRRFYLSTLTLHLAHHIIDIFSSDYIKQFPESCQDCFLFTCIQCGDHVMLGEFFSHWQMHFNIDRVDNKCLSSENQNAIEIMSPELIETVLCKLQSRKRKVSDMQCDFCSMKFRLKKHYKLHMIDHLLAHTTSGKLQSRKRKVSDMQCDVCSTKFRLKNRYKLHMIDHLLAQAISSKEYQTNKLLKCYICPKVLSDSNQWKSHMCEHTTLSKYKCNMCPGVFDNPGVLSKHKKLHAQNNTRSFICDLCSAKFLYKGSLVRHFKTTRCSSSVRNRTSTERTENTMRCRDIPANAEVKTGKKVH